MMEAHELYEKRAIMTPLSGMQPEYYGFPGEPPTFPERSAFNYCRQFENELDTVAKPSYRPEFGLENIDPEDIPVPDNCLIVDFERLEKPEATLPQPTFTDLPYELLFKIFSQVDLKTLRAAEQVCKAFAAVVQDRHLYREVNLRPCWNEDDKTCLKWLGERCSGIKKLVLSWCGIYDLLTTADVCTFLRQHGETLTHLRLNNIGKKVLRFVVMLCPNLTELCVHKVMHTKYIPYKQINCQKLIKLDLSESKFDNKLLVSLLRQNPSLQHLALKNGCSIGTSVIETIAQYNRELISLNLCSSKMHSIERMVLLRNFSKLQELNLGYSSYPYTEEDLGELVECIPQIRWLGLAGHPHVHHRQVLTKIAKHCPNLQFLDLSDCAAMLGESVHAVLAGCPALRYLNLKHCILIESRWEDWNQLYPLVKIQHE